ncbi:MAG: (d)CMP kinase, partial [Acidimicrobiales bacterium]|nr:(d)CMP kinase [Acidimicrobiales bacterium]
VVFPDAPVKVYLDARPEVRAARRSKEVGGADVEAIAADLARRDTIDSTRAASPLTEADGAVVIDTSDLTIDQVVDAVVALMP